MRYLRFLKPPKTDGKTITALITITSDLGESFLAEDVTLAATVRSEDPHGDIYLRRSLKWTAGMRSLSVTFDISHTDMDWPIRLHVGLKSSPYSDHFENHHHRADLPSLISAWSDVLDFPKGKNEAEKVVERRFTPLSNRILSIWEETGESIARHVWDAGLALSAYLDRMVALQTEGLPLLEEALSMATYKKLNVLELGCGCGIVGISLAQTVPDCDVLLTDLPEAEEIASRNIASLNPALSSSVSFQAFDWDQPLPENLQKRWLDIVLVSDCTYNPDSSPALVRTLSALVKRFPKAIIVAAMKFRHQSEMVFFDLMSKADFVTGAHTTLPLPKNESYQEQQEKVEVYVFCSKDRFTFVAKSPEASTGSPVVAFWKSEDR